MSPKPSGDSVAIIVGAHPYPFGNASANRMLGLAKVFEGVCRYALVVNDDPRLQSYDLASRGVVDEVPYESLAAPSGGRWQRWRRRRTFAARVAEAIKVVAPGEVRFVCVPSFFYTPRIHRALRDAAPRARIVVDVVERHDARQFTRGRLEPYFIRHRLTSWYAQRTADRVIVISRALAEGPFRSRHAFVLPPTVQVDEFRVAAASARPASPTTVSYVGSPGSKDDLAGLVRAVGDLGRDDRRDLRVVIGGVDLDEMARLPGLSAAALAEVQDVLQVVGKLDRRGVIDLLGRSHYTILIRNPNATFARYGFPTKVPESMAAGCPPIVNLTSDLADYLTDGRDSLICASASPSDIATALRRAVADSRTGRHLDQSRAAASTAEALWSPLAWTHQVRDWLSTEAASGS